MELSFEEKQRRELILAREFENTDMSKELLKKAVYYLHELPVNQFIEPIGGKFTAEEKQQLYSKITDSLFFKYQSDIVRAWIQLRFQDILERGHLPSDMEILCINEIFGAEFSASIIKGVLDLAKDFDEEEIERISQPKNEIEEIIFNGLKDRFKKIIDDLRRRS